MELPCRILPVVGTEEQYWRIAKDRVANTYQRRQRVRLTERYDLKGKYDKNPIVHNETVHT